MQKYSIWNISVLFVAALTGVGYSSGQEVYQFFAFYGKYGLITALLAPILLCGMSFLYIMTARRKEAAGYSEILIPTGLTALAPLVNGVVTLILVLGIVLPITAAGSLIYQLFGLPSWIGSLILTLFLALAMFVRNIGVITRVMTPLMYVFLGCICFICIYTLTAGTPAAVEGPAGVQSGFFSAMLVMLQYMSFNLLILYGVLTLVSREFRSTKSTLLCCIGCSAAVGGTVLLQYLAFAGLGGAAAGTDMPMVYAASLISPGLRLFFQISMLFGAFGASVSCFYSLMAQLMQYRPMQRLRYYIPAGIMLFAAFLLSLWGFSNVIGYAYPVIGTIGLPIHILLLVSFFQTFRRPSAEKTKDNTAAAPTEAKAVPPPGKDTEGA